MCLFVSAAGRLDLAFEMLSDVQAEGVLPGSTVCSGLILACIKDRRFDLAQKVYDICAAKVRVWLRVLSAF